MQVTANDTTLTNTATVASPTPDPVPDNNTASLSVVVAPTTDLVIAKAVAASPPGSAPTAGLTNGVVYTLSVHDAGPLTATNVGVVDLLPTGFTPSAVSAPGLTCNLPGAGGTLSCSRPTLTVADGTLTITITLDSSTAGTLVTNLAAVQAEQAELDPSNNFATADTTPIPYDDLELTKAAPPGRGRSRRNCLVHAGGREQGTQSLRRRDGHGHPPRRPHLRDRLAGLRRRRAGRHAARSARLQRGRRAA